MRNFELTPIECQKLKKAHLQLNTYMTVKAIRDSIYKKYAIKYSRSGATALLHRMGFVIKSQRFIQAK